MSSTNYTCPKCGKTKTINFKAGNKPEPPICEDCKETMNRIYTNIEIGDVIDDESLAISRMMTYHSMKN